MNPDARQLSVNLDSVAKAIAEWTVTRLAEGDATLAERYGTGWRRAWVGEMQGVLGHLAQAIAVERSEVLARMLAWSKGAFLARHADQGDFERALRSLREVLRESDLGPLTEQAVAHIDAAEAMCAGQGAAKAAPPDVPSGDTMLMLKYLDAILRGQRQEAEALIIAASRDGMPATRIYDGVLRPALVEIGRMWHQDEITVADEHFASLTTEMVMATLRPSFEPAPAKPRRLIAATVHGELHAIGVRMVSDLFELDGWNVICLGANMPTPDVVQSVRDYHGDLLALSLTGCLWLRETADLIDAVRAQDDLHEVRIMVGGATFAEIDGLATAIGADGWASSAAESVVIGNQLVGK